MFSLVVTMDSYVSIGCYYVYRCFHWLLLWIHMFPLVVTMDTDVFIGCYYGYRCFHWLLLWIQMFSLVVTMGTFVFHWLTFTTCNSFFLHVLTIHLKVLGIIKLVYFNLYNFQRMYIFLFGFIIHYYYTTCLSY